MSVYIIAEVGVNHNGSVELAKKLIDAAKLTGANAVKFQTFVSTHIVSKNTPKADYQLQQTDKAEGQLEMLKKLELPFDAFIELKKYCDLMEIDFLSTAFDLESVEFLKNLGMKLWKIPSGEITNLPYLIAIGKLGGKVLLSTGMSTVNEIEDAKEALISNGSSEVVILHCTTEYPAPFEDVNLKAMVTMKAHFNLNVGYSDHTKGIEVSIAAVALGASYIEKHFTLDRDMDGPDHKASIEPSEMEAMIRAIRNIEKALGDGIKGVSPSEQKNIHIVRKSIVAKKRINKGDLITENHITTKRPGGGISPMKWFDVVGKVATEDFEEDEMIRL